MKTRLSILLGSLLLPLTLSANEPAAATEPVSAATTTAPQPGQEASASAAALQRYVSDEIYTFLRRGPGKQYRIIGSIKAGEPVTQLALSDDGKYAKVRDSKQREAWIVASELQENPSFRSQHEQVQQQVTVLNDKLANIDSVQARELKQKSAQLIENEQALTQAQEKLASQGEELAQLRAENDKLNASLGTRKQEQIYRWLKEGGMIAGAGLLIGLIIPYLPRPRRSQRDRWLN